MTVTEKAETLGGCRGKCNMLMGKDLATDDLTGHNETVRQLGSSDLAEVAEAIFYIGVAATERTSTTPDPGDLSLFVQQHNWPDPVIVQQLAEGVTQIYMRARDVQRKAGGTLGGAA